MGELLKIFFDALRILWKKKELRVYIVNFCFALIVAAGIVYYVNFRHNEAMAEIGSTRDSEQANSKQIIENLNRLGGRIDEIYRFLLRK